MRGGVCMIFTLRVVFPATLREAGAPREGSRDPGDLGEGAGGRVASSSSRMWIFGAESTSRAWNPGHRRAGGGRRSRSRAPEGDRENYAGVETAVDIETVLEDIDVVIVATPPETHAALARGALDAGKHVLVQADGDDGRGCCRHDRPGDQRRARRGAHVEYNAAVWASRDLILEGELGRPLYIDTAD